MKARWYSGQIFSRLVNPMQLYISCEKSGGLHLVEPGLMTGWQAGRQNSGEA